ncbi:MAG: N-acetyltransferase [Sphingobacteriales bacterium]|nr:MAG: N-acetyltransferase [Sphingobacteriales bacterium]
MEKVEVVFTGHATGEIKLFSDEVQAGKMDIAIVKGRLTVYHTEVNPEFEGKGFAKLLLDRLVSYAKEKKLQIVPLCPYVSAQFNRHPDLYDEVWSKDWHE